MTWHREALSRRPRYGADGFPYLIGLSAAAAALVPVGLTALLSRRPRLAAAALAAGAAAAVPAALGLHYVVRGKFRLRDRLLGAVAWRGDEVVVDLGAGSGLLGLAAAARTAGTVHCVDLFIGKDLSGNTPGRLLRNAALLHVNDQVQLHRSDVRGTGMPAASVDVVLSSLCLHNLPQHADRIAALDEIVRILRPGGTVVISDLAHVDREYAPYLKQQGYTVTQPARIPGTFPPQRLLVAHSSTLGIRESAPD